MRRTAAILAALLVLSAAVPTQQLTVGNRSQRLLASAGDGVEDSDGGKGGGAAAGADGSVTAAAAAAAKTALSPTKTSFAEHDLYYQVPAGAKGLLIILHKCGRSGSDHWPRSPACPECKGMPESLSKTKQALARGYAVAAMSSADRSSGGGGMCWSWHTDAKAVVEAVRKLPRQLGLPAGAPVYLDGASSGGSLALRLPGIVDFDGVIGEVIAPSGYADLLADGMSDSMPPAVYIHMPRDTTMAARVTENVAALRRYKLPVAEIKVYPRRIAAGYFSDQSPLISPAVSAALLAKLKQLKLVDSKGAIAVDPKNVVWFSFKSYLSNDLKAVLAKYKPAQREQGATLVAHHVYECISTAWGRHETVGQYMTAALAWLETGGTADIKRLVTKYREDQPSALSVEDPS